MTCAKSLIAGVLVIGGCSGGGGGESVVVRTVTDRTGAPTAGVRVQVEDSPWVTTDAAGEASFEDIAEPFTVRLHEPDDAWDNVIVLGGRTGREVVAEVGGPGIPEWHSAAVSGTVSGRAGDASDSIVRVGVAPYKDYSIYVEAAADSTFDVSVLWREPPGVSSATLALHAWEVDTATPPGHYYGFARSPAQTFVEREAVEGMNLSLEPVDEAIVDATISVPAGVTVAPLMHLWLDYAPYEQLTVVAEEIDPDPFSIVVPQVPDAESWLGVWAGARWHFRLIDGASSDLAFAPPASSELLAPAEGASLSAAPVFRWNPIEPGGISSLFVSCSTPDAQSGAKFFITPDPADGDQATLPTIDGVDIPAAATCSWSVFWCAADSPTEKRCSWGLERGLAL